MDYKKNNNLRVEFNQLISSIAFEVIDSNVMTELRSLQSNIDKKSDKFEKTVNGTLVNFVNKVNSSKSKLSELERNIDALNDAAEVIKNSKEEYTSKITETNNLLESTNSTINRLNGNLEEIKKEYKNLETQIKQDNRRNFKNNNANFKNLESKISDYKDIFVKILNKNYESNISNFSRVLKVILDYNKIEDERFEENQKKIKLFTYLLIFNLLLTSSFLIFLIQGSL